MRLREYLLGICASSREVDVVVLCMEEAFSNAIRHSGSDEPVSVRLRLDDDLLQVTVKDRGTGFDVSRFHPDELPAVDAAGGRGLFLISRLMDQMELRVNHGLEVHAAVEVDIRGRAAASGMLTAVVDEAGVFEGAVLTLGQ
jgi:anti-sigma regulatory factor (Ser/Thr protein kinase)